MLFIFKFAYLCFLLDLDCWNELEHCETDPSHHSTVADTTVATTIITATTTINTNTNVIIIITTTATTTIVTSWIIEDFCLFSSVLSLSELG